MISGRKEIPFRLIETETEFSVPLLVYLSAFLLFSAHASRWAPECFSPIPQQTIVLYTRISSLRRLRGHRKIPLLNRPRRFFFAAGVVVAHLSVRAHKTKTASLRSTQSSLHYRIRPPKVPELGLAALWTQLPPGTWLIIYLRVIRIVKGTPTKEKR